MTLAALRSDPAATETKDQREFEDELDDMRSFLTLSSLGHNMIVLSILAIALALAFAVEWVTGRGAVATLVPVARNSGIGSA